MKLTKSRLKQIIKEELARALEEKGISTPNDKDVIPVPRPNTPSSKSKVRKSKGNESALKHGVLSEEEELEERKLSKKEDNKKEKVVKGMKKNKSDFKKRYGKDAESVMYATATKIAKQTA